MVIRPFTVPTNHTPPYSGSFGKNFSTRYETFQRTKEHSTCSALRHTSSYIIKFSATLPSFCVHRTHNNPRTSFKWFSQSTRPKPNEKFETTKKPKQKQTKNTTRNRFILCILLLFLLIFIISPMNPINNNNSNHNNNNNNKTNFNNRTKTPNNLKLSISPDVRIHVSIDPSDPKKSQITWTPGFKIPPWNNKDEFFTSNNYSFTRFKRNFN